MTPDTAEFGRPERIVLVLARGPKGCRGKAVRMSDGEELRFTNIDELKDWLETAAPVIEAHVPPALPTLEGRDK